MCRTQTDSRHIHHVIMNHRQSGRTCLVPGALTTVVLTMQHSAVWFKHWLLKVRQCLCPQFDWPSEDWYTLLPWYLIGVWGFHTSLLRYHRVKDQPLKWWLFLLMPKILHPVLSHPMSPSPLTPLLFFFFTLSLLEDNNFKFLAHHAGGANRRSTLIYQSSFKGAGAHGDRPKIAAPVGRKGTEAIKAHEMQMALYVRGWGWGGGLGLA